MMQQSLFAIEADAPGGNAPRAAARGTSTGKPTRRQKAISRAQSEACRHHLKELNREIAERRAGILRAGDYPVEIVAPRFRVSLVREDPGPTVVREGHIISSAEDSCVTLRPHFRGLDREALMVMTLDAKHVLIGISLVSLGSVNQSLVHPREVFKTAILQNACAIIVAHNHPSGDPTPSRDDLAVTKRLFRAGEILGIPVMDHIILGDGTNAYTSLINSHPQLFTSQPE